MIQKGLTVICILLSLGCASKILEYDKVDDLQKNAEFDKKVKIKELPIEPVVTEASSAQVVAVEETKTPVKVAKPKKEIIVPKQPKTKGKIMTENTKHLPEIEDGAGFIGRRPTKDPFRVKEKVTLALTYFNMTAGYMDLTVQPFVEVNGAKAYPLKITAKSNSLFSRFYAVDDYAETYLDYETLLPSSFQIVVKESKQLADIRTFFDFKKNTASFWEKRVRKDQPESNKKIEWDIKPFSQNVISAIFYLRTFQLEPGKKLAFHVADEGKNIVFNGTVLRRETLDSDVGELKTVVVKPEFEVDGVFKPVGDILVWLTDDDRKLVVRIESKIKIGTIVGKVKSIEPGIAVQ